MLLEPMGHSFENAQRTLTGQACWDHNAAGLQGGKNFLGTWYSHTPEGSEMSMSRRHRGMGVCVRRGFCLLDNKALSFMFLLYSFSPPIRMCEPETCSPGQAF